MRRRSALKNKQKLLATPYFFWAVAFIIIPILMVFYYGFIDSAGHFTMQNILAIASPEHSKALFLSIRLSLVSTLICLLLAYPLAMILANKSVNQNQFIVLIFILPMWMNFLIRTYAWMTILQDAGIVNGLLDKLGIAPIHVIGTETAVIIGMVYDYFPYMILPIYSILVKLDGRLVEAARDLGCNGFSVLRRVVLPLSMPGIISGITMVLIPSISTFYISQKLGSGKFFLIGDAIEGQYVANNLHFAAAIAFVLMLILLAGMAIMKYCTSRFVYGGD